MKKSCKVCIYCYKQIDREGWITYFCKKFPRLVIGEYDPWNGEELDKSCKFYKSFKETIEEND